MPPRPRSIRLDGRLVQYTVRRSPRARSLRLRVLPERGLEVVVPRRAALPDLDALLRGRAGWIIAALDRCAALAPPVRPALRPGSPVAYCGVDYRLAIDRIPGGGPRVRLDETARTLTVSLPAPSDGDLATILEAWYRARARDVLAARAECFAAALGVSYGRLAIRDQRTRWGSCSSLGNLNFNWRLILAPPAVLDYVVVHELAHRREPNHSPRFWALVAAHCPDHRAHRAWLKAHGTALMARHE